mmetsp:Transcript_41761/g.99062  ORF Transcript_41761/g.99062 Transcript_41761/m.99062 type:complete len:364 (+) Transcript_41761:1021-2112(+)
MEVERAVEHFMGVAACCTEHVRGVAEEPRCQERIALQGGDRRLHVPVGSSLEHLAQGRSPCLGRGPPTDCHALVHERLELHLRLEVRVSVQDLRDQKLEPRGRGCLDGLLLPGEEAQQPAEPLRSARGRRLAVLPDVTELLRAKELLALHDPSLAVLQELGQLAECSAGDVDAALAAEVGHAAEEALCGLERADFRLAATVPLTSAVGRRRPPPRRVPAEHVLRHARPAEGDGSVQALPVARVRLHAARRQSALCSFVPQLRPRIALAPGGLGGEPQHGPVPPQPLSEVLGDDVPRRALVDEEHLQQLPERALPGDKGVLLRELARLEHLAVELQRRLPHVVVSAHYRGNGSAVALHLFRPLC